MNGAGDGIIHAALVAFICISATIYATVTKDHSNNIWIVYGSAVAFAAGRAGVSAARTLVRSTDSTTPEQAREAVRILKDTDDAQA